MRNLNGGQRWALVAIAYAAVVMIAVFLLKGNAQTLLIILGAFVVAGYAVISSQSEKPKNS